MANKLYPPLIDGVLPAFYLTYDSSGAVLKGGGITVPFTMNASVGESQVKGFSLRIRTAASGSYVLPPLFSNIYSLTRGEVTFNLTSKHASVFNEGQYYKIQLAYCSECTIDAAGNLSAGSEEIGYYSTVGVAKCTSRANVTIKGLEYENINAFNNEMFGFYDLTNCKDKTEKVYSYEFKVYDEEENIFFSSGEKLHQASYDTDYTYSLDRIVLNDFASTDTIYSVEYTVTTLNGLVISSPRYRVSSQYLVSSNDDIQILPEADEENGIITIHFYGGTDPARTYHYTIDDEKLNQILVDEEGQPLKDSSLKTMVDKTIDVLNLREQNEKIVYLRNHDLYKHYYYDTQRWYYEFLPHLKVASNLKYINGKYYLKSDVSSIEVDNENDEHAYDAYLDYLNTLEYYEFLVNGNDTLKTYTTEYVEQYFINLNDKIVIDTVEGEKRYYGSYLLSRASDEDNYTTWFNIARFRIDDQVPSEFSVQDVTIEHGRKYKYALQQYNIWGLYSARNVSDVFEASFEDAFLYDGERALRIRYNPTVDTFKTTILEQKTDTIGGRFPFITRNGATWYKEFPLGGLLAQEIDQQHYFVNPFYGEAHRHATHDDDVFFKDNAFLNYHDFSDTAIALERNFKLKVLDWLNDGKPKLFKSPYEGNYIVRLMNVSLTPVKELGRMLHSFTSQAYEIAECTYENLVAYGFIKTDIPSDFIGLWRSYDLQDDSLVDKNGDIVILLDAGIQNFTVQDLMPGDMIYLTFSDEIEELPIMIGITGSYTYEGINKNLVKIRIPKSDEHEMVGTINVFYEGMRITDFDSIISMQLKTIISQQYVGTSPWMQRLKRVNWEQVNNQGDYYHLINDAAYKELQNYNFRTYLDQTVQPDGSGNFLPTENFAKLARSFDPGELLDRINLSINQNDKYKTQVVNMEIMRFRERPVIPVFTHQTHEFGDLYVPGEYITLLKKDTYPRSGGNDLRVPLLVSTSPLGIPHPIEELAEYEMLDPFCIYEVFEQNASRTDWVPIVNYTVPYYDPYYRTWLAEDYDPTVGLDCEWVQVACLDRDQNGNLTPEAQYLYEQNIIHQENKLKKARGEYVSQAIKEDEMYDYELKVSHYDDKKGYIYYYEDADVHIIKENAYDLYTKTNDQYFALGTPNVPHNKVFWVKRYKINLNLETEKVIEYRDLDLMNSYHIGNGVIAELTFQLRIVDYYTEIYDDDVRLAKEKYLEAKQFYSQLMANYNIIAKANQNKTINYAFMELYNRMLYGNSEKNNMEDKDILTIWQYLNMPKLKEELKLMSLYTVTLINSALPTDILDLLIAFKKAHIESEDILNDFNNIELYYYFEETSISTYDEYYVVDSRDFEDDTNAYYLIDNSVANTQPDDWVTYRYKDYNDNAVFYYKVNKEAYISNYMSGHSLAVPSSLVIVYNRDTDDFMVRTKSDIVSDGKYEVQELVKQDEALTSDYLDLLNDDELAALEVETLFLDASLVTNNNRYLYEEQEIETIINKLPFEGAYSKYFAISNEVTNLENQLQERQNELNNAIANYAEAYAGAFGDETSENNSNNNNNNNNNNTNNNGNANGVVKTYNDQVYDDWCARVLLELLDDEQYTMINNFKEQIAIKRAKNQEYIDNTTGTEQAYYQDKATYYNLLEARVDLQINNGSATDKANADAALQPYLRPEGSSATVAHTVSNLSYTKEMLDLFYKENNEKDILSTLNKVYTNSITEADIKVTSDVEIAQNYLYATDELYKIVNDRLPTIEVYEKMIKENINDETLDEYLRNQISYIRGEIVLAFYALYNAIAKVIDMLNDGTFDGETASVKNNLINSCISAMTKYNTLYPLLIDTDHYNKFKTANYNDIELQDITDYLITTYQLYMNLKRQEELKYVDPSYFNLTNLALVSNYHNDFMYLIQNIKNNNNYPHEEKHLTAGTSNNYGGIGAIGVQAAIWNFDKPKYKDGNNLLPIPQLLHNTLNAQQSIYNLNPANFATYDAYMAALQEIINGTITGFFDPLTDTSSDNFFKSQVDNMSAGNKTALKGSGYKNLSTYFYRSSLTNDAFTGSKIINNPIRHFILNPLSTTMLDPKITRSVDIINNYTYFNSLSVEQQKLCLDVYGQVSARLLSIATNVTGINATALKTTITSRYISNPDSASSNLFTRRETLLNGTAEKESDRSLFILLQSVRTALTVLMEEHGPNYVLEGTGLTLSQIQDKLIIAPAPYSGDYTVDGRRYQMPQFQIPYNKTTTLNYTTNWYQPLYIPAEVKLLMTELSEDTQQLEDEGVYHEYLEEQFREEIEQLSDLSDNAKILQRLYKKQTEIYQAKYDSYADEYNILQTLYASYSGTKAFEFYNLLNRTIKRESFDTEAEYQAALEALRIEQADVVANYQATVQEAWWAFLNLLDARYSAEKERGMYL